MTAVPAQPLRSIDPTVDAARLQAAVQRWRRRSRLIHFFRRALPALIVLILAGLLITMAVQTFGRRAEPETNVSVRMLNPRFRGRDDRGRAFLLSAREAVRDARNFQRVLLQDPSMVLQTQPDATPLRVTAKSGVYMEDTQVMTMQGEVRLSDPSGWNFATERAVVDTRRDLITGDQPIQGVSPSQRISANSFAIYNRGERFVFSGNVKSSLNN